MKFKATYIMIIIFIICSLSCVAAVDDNGTVISQNINYDDNVSLSIENDYVGSSDIQSEPLSYEGNNSDNLSSPHIKDTNSLYGIVDVGSNSLSLNIYKEDNGKIKQVYAENKDSVIAKYKKNNVLTEDGINQLILILNDYDKKMNSKNVDIKYYFATASLRNIGNSGEVVTAVKNSLGIDLHVLTGEEEAYMGFNAVKRMDLATDDGLLVEIGGGSCQITIFANKNPVIEKSMPIGSLACYNEYISSIFPNESEMTNIQNRVIMELNKLKITTSLPIYDLYGNGGAIYTFKKLLIYLGEIDDDTDAIPVSMVDSTLNKLLKNTTETYRIMSNVDSSRITTLIPGIIIAKVILNYFQVSYLHFCKSKMEEGIVYELIENNTHHLNPNDTSDDYSNDVEDNILNTVKANTVKASVDGINIKANTVKASVDDNNSIVNNISQVNRQPVESTIKNINSNSLPIIAIILCLMVILGMIYKKKR
ncbi:hypothetical protein [Methanobrevibacter sp.]|uniref:Ppx/GppA phosphatase family protein n=1 Tax=Methanobrevibacter sp. TaxID=66852 RepID=UPI00386C2435